MISQTSLNTSQNNIAFKGNLTKVPIEQLMGKVVKFDNKQPKIPGSVEAIRGTGIKFCDVLTITGVEHNKTINHTTVTIKNNQGLESSGWSTAWFDCLKTTSPLARIKNTLAKIFSK